MQALINFYHQLEDERNGKQPTEVVNDDREGGGAVKRKTSLGLSLIGVFVVVVKMSICFLLIVLCFRRRRILKING